MASGPHPISVSTAWEPLELGGKNQKNHQYLNGTGDFFGVFFFFSSMDSTPEINRRMLFCVTFSGTQRVPPTSHLSSSAIVYVKYFKLLGETEF